MAQSKRVERAIWITVALGDLSPLAFMLYGAATFHTEWDICRYASCNIIVPLFLWMPLIIAVLTVISLFVLTHLKIVSSGKSIALTIILSGLGILEPFILFILALRFGGAII